MRTFLISELMYSDNYLRRTKKQKETLKVLNREAMLVVMGLSRFTESGALLKYAQMK